MFSTHLLDAQTTRQGEIAREFTINTYGSDELIRLSDFEGKILVLDFFAHWCGPCRTSSPDLEVNVNQYFAERKGNTHGIPVSVLPVNIESSGESLTASFIRSAGLTWVAEDLGYDQAYGQFDTGSIPLFVIINGVASSPTHEQWQVLYRGSGYPGAEAIRTIIDSVEPPREGPPSFSEISGKRVYRAGEPIALSVKKAQGTQPLTYEWYRDGVRISNATGAELVVPDVTTSHSGDYHVVIRNALGEIESDKISIEVLDTLAETYFGYDGPSIEIPDADQNGISSSIEIDYGRPAFGILLEAVLEHEYPDDLYIILISPNGRAYHFNLRHQHFSSDGMTFAYDLTGYLAIVPDGEWTLKAYDTETLDEGRLQKWSLTVTGPVQPNILYTHQVSPEVESVAIPDNNPEGLKSQLSVSLQDPILKSEVYLVLSHSYFPDLVVDLIAPDGRVLPLLNRVNFDEEELAMTQVLADWEGKPMNGDWTLRVVDNDQSDQGELVTWGIRMINDVDREPGFRPPYFVSEIPNTLEQALSHQLVAEDPDGDSLTFRRTSGPDWLTVSSNGEVSGLVPEGFFGTVQIVVEVNDDGNPPLTDTQSWQFEIVRPPNEPPVLTSETIFELTEGVLWEQQLLAEDPEDHAVTFSSKAVPSWLSFSSDGRLEGIPPSGTQGQQIQFHVLLTDNGQPPADSLTPIVLKIEAVKNLPPQLVSKTTFEIKEGTSWDLLLEAQDPEGGKLSFSSPNLPAWLVLTPDGRLQGLPPKGVEDQVLFDLILRDDGVQPAESKVTIELTISGAQNQPPIIVSDATLTVPQHMRFEFQVQAEDPNGDYLTFSIQNAEEWISMTEDGLLQGFPPLTASGRFPFSIEVKDSNENALSTSQQFVLNVVPKPENRPPEITSNPITTANPGGFYEYAIEASDPDGDDLNYLLPFAPSWLQINQNGILTGSVPAGLEIPIKVIIGVSDSASPPKVVFQEFSIMPEAPPAQPRLSIEFDDLVIQQAESGKHYWLIRWESIQDMASGDWNSKSASIVAGPMMATDSRVTFLGILQTDNINGVEAAFFTVMVTRNDKLEKN